MKFLSLLVLASTLFLLVGYSQNLGPVALSTFLKGKVKERGFACLVDILENFNKKGLVIPGSNLDDKIREGVNQSIDLTTLLLQFTHLSD